MADHNELGKKGEALAAEFVTKKSYKILERNYRFKHLEADIIATHKKELIIIEVKTRNSSFMADAHETVSRGKQKSLIKVANAYILENDLDLETRFDIISILLNEKVCEIEHLEDAFYPTL